MHMTVAPKRMTVLRCLLVATLSLLVAAGCSGEQTEHLPGEPTQGKRLIRDYGCGSCHIVPNVPGANGRVGPPLDRMAKRAYIGGVITNTPEHMVRWIMAPEAVDPRTAMPNLGVSESDARDITAYLYTLK
jgi:cytochrome c2